MYRKPFQSWRKNQASSSSSSILIKGRSVILREKRLEDTEDDYHWRTDEELSRLDDTRPLSISYEDFLNLSKEELKRTSPWSLKLAIDTYEGKHIGNCMYYDMDQFKQQTEVGIMIGDKSYWNCGYGADVLATLVDFIFRVKSMKRVYLHTLEWNARARSSFAKAGFKEVKRVIRGGNMFVQMETWRNGSHGPLE